MVIAAPLKSSSVIVSLVKDGLSLYETIALRISCSTIFSWTKTANKITNTDSYFSFFLHKYSEYTN